MKKENQKQTRRETPVCENCIKRATRTLLQYFVERATPVRRHYCDECYKERWEHFAPRYKLRGYNGIRYARKKGGVK